MKALLGLSRVIDAINSFIGRWIAWLILAAVLVSASNAIVRKLFNISSNAWLELQWYLYGAVFLLAAAYTLQKNEHVRIDVVSARLSKKTRDWIDLLGHIFFLLPFAGVIAWLAWPWFFKAYHSGEVSAAAGGLVIWPAKLSVLVGFTLLTAQAISEIIKRIGVIRGLIDEPYEVREVPPAVVEMEIGVHGVAGSDGKDAGDAQK